MFFKPLLLIFTSLFLVTNLFAQNLQDENDPSLIDGDASPFQQEQPGIDTDQRGLQAPEEPRRTVREYTIGGIEVTGNVGISRGLVTNIAGLRVGQSISVPGDDISRAIKNLWNQDFFSDVSITIDDIRDGQIYLNIELQTRNRLSGYELNGVERRSRRKAIDEKLDLTEGDVVTEFYQNSINRKIKDYYLDKGFPDATVDIESRPDSLFDGNSVFLTINVDRGERVRIKDINFYGNEAFSDFRLRRTLDDTKQRQRLNFFRSSKFNAGKYEQDKRKLINRYRREGYRDAYIERDSVYRKEEDLYTIDIYIVEGNQYYFRDISWAGNTKYESEVLSSVLGIKRGDVYNPEMLSRRLHQDPHGNDVSSLYMDDGHLFFNANPIELRVDNDSVDILVQIQEGPQAVINEITFSGNTKTNDHVILREIRTRPGKKFSRSDVIRTQRELAQLGYFDPERMDVIPKPNPEDGTVDIEYKLAEKESDQVELSGGYGAGQFIFTLGLEFNNFSLRNINKRDAWRPLPTGDGQKLRLRAQSNGRFFQSYNISFTEPWFGGRKPNSFNVSVYHSIQSNGRRRDDPERRDIQISGASVGLGKRLTIPDDYFTLNNRVNYQRYQLNNWRELFAFTDGSANNLNFEHRLTRNSIDAPIYPRRGSRVSLSVQWTPPYSLFDDRDYSTLTPQERFKWLEFHKWKFDASWFFNITDRLVLNTRTEFGFLGRFDRSRDVSPFERFYLGGDGLSGFTLDGRELIRLRGYDDNAITPVSSARNRIGGNVYNKYTFELRYPVTLNPNATIYLLTFAEAGHNRLGMNNFDPFDLYRSAGAGIRVFLPMFGLLGFDWGYGFDSTAPSAQFNEIRGGHNFHISIGQEF